MTKIKNRIALRYATNRARHIKKVISFNDAVKMSQTAIFLMPRMSVEFYLARSVVESFLRYFRRVALVVPESMRELATYRSEVIVVSQADETWLKLPSRDLVERVRSKGFDIAFDLSYSADIFMSYLCLESEAKVSVGFAKENVEYFYDMQIRVPQDAELKRAYDILSQTIKMFKEK